MSTSNVTKSKTEKFFHLIKGDSLLDEQNYRLAQEIIDKLSPYIENEKIEKKFVEDVINDVLTKISKKDNEFANLILKILLDKYPDYDFKI